MGTVGGSIRRELIGGRSNGSLLSGLSTLFLFTLVFGVTVAQEAERQPRAVPAEYLRDLSLPGSQNHFLRPSAIHVDKRFDEIFVADPGNNRIVIFDENGVYRHEFRGRGHFSTPWDLTVDSEGFIYVLATAREGRRLLRFDFDGTFVRSLPLPEEMDGLPVDFRSVVLDDRDRLYLLDQAGMRVCVYDREGTLLDTFGILGSMESDLLAEQIVGRMRIKSDRLFVPAPAVGSIYVYDLSGNHLRTIGHKGSTVGQLNFPVDVALTDDGLVLILDKHRFNVVCFNMEGDFYGEFGGKGISPGWFYHPSLLAVDEDDQVYVGQIFKNKVQVCRIPEFIKTRHLRMKIDRKKSDDLGHIPYGMKPVGSTSDAKEEICLGANTHQGTRRS